MNKMAIVQLDFTFAYYEKVTFLHVVKDKSCSGNTIKKYI